MRFEMVSSWNNILGIILLLFAIAPFIRCRRRYCRKDAMPYFSVYYGEEGGEVHLDIKAANIEHYAWIKDGRPLTLSKCRNHSKPNCLKRFPSKSRADLHLRDITREDSGKYIVELFCPLYRAVYSFQVIVKTKPFLYIDCSDMVVYEGVNISCICKATNTNSPTSATWIRNKPQQDYSELKKNTDILRLVNVSRRETGTYTCHAKDNNFINSTSFSLEVISRSIIATNRGMVPVKIDCLNATGPATHSYAIEWKIQLIVGSCSYFAGLMMCCILIFSCKKLCAKRNPCGNSIYDDVLPRAAKEGLRDICFEEKNFTYEYEVPEPRNMHQQHDYGRRYHELSQLRDRDEERYQSLNPIDS